MDQFSTIDNNKAMCCVQTDSKYCFISLAAFSISKQNFTNVTIDICWGENINCCNTVCIEGPNAQHNKMQVCSTAMYCVMWHCVFADSIALSVITDPSSAPCFKPSYILATVYWLQEGTATGSGDGRQWLLYCCTVVLLYCCCTAVLLLYCCCTAVLLYCCTVVLLLYCCTAVLLYCCTAVLLLYCCTAVLLYCCTVVLLYCCTAVLLLYCCTAVLLYCWTVVLL